MRLPQNPSANSLTENRIMMNTQQPCKYNDFLSQLPAGISELSTPRGEAVVLSKSENCITLTKKACSSHEVYPVAAGQRCVNFNFVSEATDDNIYTLSECWEEPTDASETPLYYPVNHTNQFIAESIIADVLKAVQPICAV